MKTKRSWSLTALVTAGLATLILPFQSASAEVREQTFRFASVQVPEHPFSRGGQRFAEIIEQKSGGKASGNNLFLM